MIHVREMGCTPAELAHWLEPAMGSYYPQTGYWLDNNHQLGPPNPLIQLRVTALPARRIALIEIPITRVEFIFPKDWDVEQIQGVLDRFDLYTRRGGG